MERITKIIAEVEEARHRLEMAEMRLSCERFGHQRPEAGFLISVGDAYPIQVMDQRLANSTSCSEAVQLGLVKDDFKDALSRYIEIYNYLRGTK